MRARFDHMRVSPYGASADPAARPRTAADSLNAPESRAESGIGKLYLRRNHDARPGSRARARAIQPMGANGFDGAVNLEARAEVPVGLVKPRAKHNSQY